MRFFKIYVRSVDDYNEFNNSEFENGDKDIYLDEL